ncbi:unnamed protein product [Brachionus calyciflorus]|uniref:RING-type domain-containing protein n=1 Tax=Brachionus calyciflorus TaxID=104777 RepID=A0A814PVF2_9BILA|nr:unnamed protein product [Brachionus calyciflorus]
MSSALIETININADDFTDNFLTCPTCMLPYDDSEHTPKLLPCSHTLCRSCLDRIASTAIPISNGSGINLDSLNSSPTVLINNSISRSIAAADAAAAAMNGTGTLPQDSNLSSSPRLNMNGSRLSNTSLSSNRISDLCIRCPICRESIIIPRVGGTASLPPSFIINQLLDLVKNQRSRDIIPRCINHTNEELLFCETCDKSFCSLCESHFKIASNADHIIIPFSIAIKRMTEIFLFKSNQCINSFNLAQANVQNEILNLNKTVENIVVEVEKSFDDIKILIDKRKQNLLKELTRIKDTKTNLLNDQIKLIINEKQKIEYECKQYHQSNIESKQLGLQIQNINEKLDCLRTLCEPRENSFINYNYKNNNVLVEMDGLMEKFGKFKISNTYPPLCSFKILNSNSSVYSANLSIDFLIETVDYYGRKRTEGGDPITVSITDPYSRQINFDEIIDLNNGTYQFRIIPSLIGKYRIDINIFSRSINQSPIYLNIVDYVDSLWTFGGGGNSGNNSIFSFNNKGSSDREFNMPISVRYLNNLIYVLDSGNNRIKILSDQGQFVGHVKHDGLVESSTTSLVISNSNLVTLNWRLKSLCKFNIENSNLDKIDLGLDEPINLMETCHPQLYLVQDNKKKMFLCSSKGHILYDSIEIRLRNELSLKNITCFCASFINLSIFVGDSSMNIYEVDLDWLCENKLEGLLEKNDLEKMDRKRLDLNYKKFNYPLNQKMMSSSLTSLSSTISSTSNMTTFTTNSSSSSIGVKSNGSYTALWHDKNTNKLLVAKSDKQKTVIEIFNGDNGMYQYSIENSQNEKSLKRVTSMCTTNDGKIICVDLIQNFVKIFKFI